MVKYSCIFLLLFFLPACQLESSSETTDILLRSAQQFIQEDGGHIDKKHGSIQEFKHQYFKVEIGPDTTYAQAIHCVNSCGDAIAAIEIHGDTIVLSTKEQSKELCASSQWHLYKYWLKSTEGTTYIIERAR